MGWDVEGVSRGLVSHAALLVSVHVSVLIS